MIAPTKATNTVGKSPPPAETPRVLKIQPPTTLPAKPSTISPISPYPPSFITIPASQPASNPTTTHETNIPNSMIRPPSSGARSVGRHHAADQGLRARGVGPDGQRGDVGHVGRADPHGVFGSPAYGAGDRWDHGRRVSGDVSHVHATEWILRRRARERGRGSSTSVIRRTVLGSAGMGGGRRLRGGVSRRHGPV